MNQTPFGPHAQGDEWVRLSRQVASSPDGVWARLLEITEITDDAGLFWVADILEDLVLRDPGVFIPRLESEASSNRRLRRALLDFVPPSVGEEAQDRLLELRSVIERESAVDSR